MMRDIHRSSITVDPSVYSQWETMSPGCFVQNVKLHESFSNIKSFRSYSFCFWHVKELLYFNTWLFLLSMTLLFFQSRDSSFLLLSLYSFFFTSCSSYIWRLSLYLSLSLRPALRFLLVFVSSAASVSHEVICAGKSSTTMSLRTSIVYHTWAEGKIERTSTASESVSLLIGGRDDDWCASFSTARHKCSKSLVRCASHWKTTSLIVEDSKVTDCQDDVNLWCGTDIPQCVHVSWSWPQRLNDDEMKMESSAGRVTHYWIELLQTTRVRTP